MSGSTNSASTRLGKLERALRKQARESFVAGVVADFEPALARASNDSAAAKLVSGARDAVIKSGARAAEEAALERFLAADAVATEVLTPAPMSLDALRNPTTIRIGVDGQRLGDDATDYVAVLLPQFDLLYSAVAPIQNSWSEAIEAGRAFELFGDRGEWQLWDDIEAQLTIDRSREGPAVLPPFITHTPTDHIYWTRRTLASSSSGSAIYVLLHLGSVGWGDRSFRGRARFVRRVPWLPAARVRRKFHRDLEGHQIEIPFIGERLR